MIDFTKVCRACNNKRANLLFLFLNDNEDEPSLGDKFSMCTSLVVSEMDNLPQTICYTCAKSLETAFAFRKMCLQSDSDLKSVLMKEKLEENIKPNTTKDTSDIQLSSESLTFETEEDVETLIECIDDEDIESTEDDMSLVDSMIDCSNEVNEFENEYENDSTQEIVSDRIFPKEIQNIHTKRKINICTSVPIPKVPKTSTEQRDESKKNEESDDMKQNISSLELLSEQLICSQCQKEFFTTNALNLHLKIHNKLRKINDSNSKKATKMCINECKQCDLIFEDPSEYRKHVLREHAYRCKICGEHSNNQYELKKHKELCELKQNLFT